MRLWIPMLLAMTTAASAGPLLPGDEARLNDALWGCQKEASDKLDEFVSQNDRAAFRKFLLSARLAGACKEFRRGTTVLITEVSLWYGRTQVREKGEIESWWVTTGVLDEVAVKKTAN